MGKINFKAARADITAAQFKDVLSEYKRCLRMYPFPKEMKFANTGASIVSLKRNLHDVGPYKGLTIFEVANRIATDMVLLNGISQMISAGKIKLNDRLTLYFGTERKKDCGDFIVNGRHGEVFNVAPTYLREKLRSTLKKWSSSELHSILLNADATNETNSNWLKQKIKEHSKIDIIQVQNWQKL